MVRALAFVPRVPNRREPMRLDRIHKKLALRRFIAAALRLRPFFYNLGISKGISQNES
jgi:hypothetical protein